MGEYKIQFFQHGSISVPGMYSVSLGHFESKVPEGSDSKVLNFKYGLWELVSGLGGSDFKVIPAANVMSHFPKKIEYNTFDLFPVGFDREKNQVQYWQDEKNYLILTSTEGGKKMSITNQNDEIIPKGDVTFGSPIFPSKEELKPWTKTAAILLHRKSKYLQTGKL